MRQILSLGLSCPGLALLLGACSETKPGRSEPYVLLERGRLWILRDTVREELNEERLQRDRAIGRDDSLLRSGRLRLQLASGERAADLHRAWSLLRRFGIDSLRVSTAQRDHGVLLPVERSEILAKCDVPDPWRKGFALVVWPERKSFVLRREAQAGQEARTLRFDDLDRLEACGAEFVYSVFPSRDSMDARWNRCRLQSARDSLGTEVPAPKDPSEDAPAQIVQPIRVLTAGTRSADSALVDLQSVQERMEAVRGQLTGVCGRQESRNRVGWDLLDGPSVPDTGGAP